MGLFYILSKTDRSAVQIDSKEGYLTLWRHQPYPRQSLNPQTVVEFEGQEVESDWIFQNVLSLVVQKHSYKLDYQDKFLVLKHSSLRLFFKDISYAFAWRLVIGEVQKAPRAIRELW